MSETRMMTVLARSNRSTTASERLYEAILCKGSTVFLLLLMRMRSRCAAVISKHCLKYKFVPVKRSENTAAYVFNSQEM